MGRWIGLAAVFCAAPLAAQVLDRSALGGMSDKVTEAEKELTVWFNLIKDGNAAASWERAGPRFKQYFFRETWQRVWSGSVGGFQPILGRKITAVRYVPIEASRYPEAVVFDTKIEFQGGTFGGETIILAFENARWQVWDYAVSPSLQYFGPTGFRTGQPGIGGHPSPPAPSHNVNRVAPRPKDPPGRD